MHAFWCLGLGDHGKRTFYWFLNCMFEFGIWSGCHMKMPKRNINAHTRTSNLALQLTARERIQALLDENSFLESGKRTLSLR